MIQTSTMENTDIKSDSNFFKKYSKFLVIFFWIAIIASFIYYSSSNELSALEAVKEIQDVVTDNWWGPLLYIAIYVARPVILFPASLLTILAGVVFGLVGGSLLVVVASNLSVAVMYLVGSYFSNAKFLDKQDGKLKNFIDKARTKTLETTLIMRLIFLPFDLVGYVAGLAQLKFIPFMVGSFLGTIVGTIAFVGIGASVDNLDDAELSFDWRILVGSLLLAVAGIVVSKVLDKRVTGQKEVVA